MTKNLKGARLQQRPPAEEVTRGLNTTSDKIRALAKAGYGRTEISKHLGIVYQHVRKVLLDAGVTDGLKRKVQIERDPIVVESLAARKDSSSEVLLRAGFQVIGEWTQNPESAIQLDTKAPLQPGVYAFVVEDLVVYVGLTNNNLKARFEQYRRGHERQRTNSRVNKLISKALSDGKRVKVLIAIPEPLAWHDLPVNTAAGLEAGLIEMIQPAWNITGIL